MYCIDGVERVWIVGKSGYWPGFASVLRDWNG